MQTSLNQQISASHQISESHIDRVIKLIDNFSTSMVKTVNDMLINKQSSVSNVYNQYIFKIKDEITQLRQKIQHQNQRIHQYQSEGMVADLLKKIKNLENQQNQLLKTIDKKNSEIRQLKLENIINKSQNKRMQQKIKQFMRSKARHGITMQSICSTEPFESIQTFSTQTSPQKQVSVRTKLSQHQDSIKSRFTKQKSVRSQATLNCQSVQNMDIIKLQKQLMQAKKQNKQLLSINNRIITESQDAQKFFLDTVAEIKNNISLRKKIKQCSFEQFRKQDKLQLLIKIISNQDILYHLYRRIFGKHASQGEQVGAKGEKKSKQKLNIHPKARFPMINSGNSFLS